MNIEISGKNLERDRTLMINNSMQNSSSVSGTIEQNKIQKQEETQVLRVECIRDEEGFNLLHMEWSKLCEYAETHIFQTFEWQRIWWKHFGQKDALFVVVFKYGNDLVGIAPLYIDAYTVGGVQVYRYLRFIGSYVPYKSFRGSFYKYSISDYLDMIVLPGFEEMVADGFLDFLKDNSDLYNEIVFDEVSDLGFIVNEILPELQRRSWGHNVSPVNLCPKLAIPSSIDEYMQTRKGKVRRKLKKVIISMEEINEITFRDRTTFEGFKENTFSLMVQMHQSRWNKLGLPSTFADNRFKEFIYEVFLIFQEQGWLWLKTTEWNGQPVAISSAFFYQNYVYDYIKSYDADSVAAKHRPGHALFIKLLSDSIGTSSSQLDMLRGNERYKLELTDKCSVNYRITVTNPDAAKSTLFIRFNKAILIAFNWKQRLQREFFNARSMASSDKVSWYILQNAIHLFQRFKVVITKLRKQKK